MNMPYVIAALCKHRTARDENAIVIIYVLSVWYIAAIVNKETSIAMCCLMPHRGSHLGTYALLHIC